MSDLTAMIMGFLLGASAVVYFISSNKDVQMVNFNSDGSKWVKHDKKTYDLVERKAVAE